MAEDQRPADGGGSTSSAAPFTRLDRDGYGARFVNSHRKLWWVAVSVLGRREQAEDVLQEAALIAMEKLDEFDPSTSFDAWMAQIVRFVALNAARKSQRRAARHRAETHEAEAPLPRDTARVDSGGALGEDHGAFDDDLLAALRALPETQRTCLLLRVVEGLPYRDVAAMLSMPEGTAMSHVHRARIALRRELEGRTGR